MKRTAAEIAAVLGGEVVGKADVLVTGLRSIQRAGPGDATFLSRPSFIEFARKTSAAVVLVPLDWTEPLPVTVIRVKNPSSAFQRLVELDAPPAIKFKPGIHPTAVVAENAVLGKDVSVQPYAVIEEGAIIGDGSIIGAYCYIGHETRIGSGCHLWPRVTVRERCVIGNRVIIHSGAVLGADGFGFENTGAGLRKIAQVGIVEIEDDVEIGANTTIDRARFDRTLVRQGAKIDNLVQIGHNVIVGRHAIICGQVGVSGSSTIGDRTILAGQVGVADHLTVGEGSIIMAQTGISEDVPPKSKMFGSMAHDYALGLRIEALKPRLPEIFARMKEVEKRIMAMEAKEAGKPQP